MNSIFTRCFFISVFMTITVGMAACVQMPTEKHGISDIRPLISFRPASESLHASRVFIDGLEMGAVSDYLEGIGGLRILPGMHTLRIVNQGQTIFEEKFYAPDGVNRTFMVQGRI